MASTINADVTNGLVLTPDTSGEIKLQAGGADIATVTSSGITMASGKTIAGNVGKVLQVVSITKTSRFTTTSTSFTNVTDFAASITPSSTSSKILIIASTTGACNAATGPVHINLTRDGSSIYIGDAVNSAVRGSSNLASPSADKAQAMSINYLDSPATTSSVTYQIQIRSESGSIVAVGGSVNTSVANVSSAAPSTITLMEVAG